MNGDLFVILATGPSMCQALADSVRGKAKVIAVSDSYKLAPWADALVSYDAAWWTAHPEAHNFMGDKFSKFNQGGARGFNPIGVPMGCNSGLFGMFVAKAMGAKKIALCGFDMHGSHWFGPHDENLGLKNTTAHRFAEHLKQFEFFEGPAVVNCTPNSALKRYDFVALDDILDA